VFCNPAQGGRLRRPRDLTPQDLPPALVPKSKPARADWLGRPTPLYVPTAVTVRVLVLVSSNTHMHLLVLVHLTNAVDSLSGNRHHPVIVRVPGDHIVGVGQVHGLPVGLDYAASDWSTAAASMKVFHVERTP